MWKSRASVSEPVGPNDPVAGSQTSAEARVFPSASHPPRGSGHRDALSPRAATLLWLDELRRFEDLPDYVLWLMHGRDDEPPLHRITRRAAAGARRTSDGEPDARVYEAETQAVRDGAFLHELVIVLNGAAHTTLEHHGLVSGALYWQMRAISAEWMAAFRDIDGDLPPIMEKWNGWRDDVHGAWTGLHVREEARRRLERRYFDGRVVVLAEPAERLALLVEGADILLGLCLDLPTFQGLGATVENIETQTDVTRTRLIANAEPRVEAAVARLVDEATAATLDLLGERERSVRVMARHIRTVVEVPEEP